MTNDGKKIGLALSGGGYRAAAYHIGALRALYKLGVLDKVDYISSVSGGSIIAAYYGLSPDFPSFKKSFSTKLQTGVSHLALCVFVAVITAAICLSVWGGWIAGTLSVLTLYFLWYRLMPVSSLIAFQYDLLFFGKKKLDDLPEKPVITINSTDYPSVSQFTFSREQVYGYYYGDGAFYHEGFPISKAVMASSCVPFAFCPIRIPKKFFTGKMKRKEAPLLLDGGLYDNQGTHVLTDKMSPYESDYIIVSDAGNGEVSGKHVYNPLVTLKRTSEVFMQRIKKVQVQQNIYLKAYPNKRFAYAQLNWNVDESSLHGFVNNLVDGNIYPEVIAAHQIDPLDIIRLRNETTKVEARKRIIAKLKENVRWDELNAIKPNADEHSKAYAIGTWLFGLSKEKICLLAKEAEWKTTLQVRLYLPFLLTK